MQDDLDHDDLEAIRARIEKKMQRIENTIERYSAKCYLCNEDKEQLIIHECQWFRQSDLFDDIKDLSSVEECILSTLEILYVLSKITSHPILRKVEFKKTFQLTSISATFYEMARRKFPLYALNIIGEVTPIVNLEPTLAYQESEKFALAYQESEDCSYVRALPIGQPVTSKSLVVEEETTRMLNGSEQTFDYVRALPIGQPVIKERKPKPMFYNNKYWLTDLEDNEDVSTKDFDLKGKIVKRSAIGHHLSKTAVSEYNRKLLNPYIDSDLFWFVGNTKFKAN